MDKTYPRHLRMTDDQLRAERQEAQDWIDGPKNDGRLTANSSAYLDYCFDTLERVDAELARRSNIKALPVRTTTRIETTSVTGVGELLVINSPDVARELVTLEPEITLRVRLGDALVDVHLSANDASDLAKTLGQAARRSESTLEKFLRSPWGKFFVGLEHLIDHDPGLVIGDGDPLSKIGSSRFGLDGSADLAFSFQGDECSLTFGSGRARLCRSGQEIRAWTVRVPPPDVAEWFKELKAALAE